MQSRSESAIRLQPMFPSAETEEQISYLLNSKDKKLHVKIMPVQRQKGCSDCGLFALAFGIVLHARNHLIHKHLFIFYASFIYFMQLYEIQLNVRAQ